MNEHDPTSRGAGIRTSGVWVVLVRSDRAPGGFAAAFAAAFAAGRAAGRAAAFAAAHLSLIGSRCRLSIGAFQPQALTSHGKTV